MARSGGATSAVRRPTTVPPRPRGPSARSKRRNAATAGCPSSWSLLPGPLHGARRSSFPPSSRGGWWLHRLLHQVMPTSLAYLLALFPNPYVRVTCFWVSRVVPALLILVVIYRVNLVSLNGTFFLRPSLMLLVFSSKQYYLLLVCRNKEKVNLFFPNKCCSLSKVPSFVKLIDRLNMLI